MRSPMHAWVPGGQEGRRMGWELCASTCLRCAWCTHIFLTGMMMKSVASMRPTAPQQIPERPTRVRRAAHTHTARPCARSFRPPCLC